MFKIDGRAEKKPPPLQIVRHHSWLFPPIVSHLEMHSMFYVCC